jgi:Fe-S cluster assembly scaffold protein SufB
MPPTWPKVEYPPVDFQAISYYSAPKKKGDGPKSLDEVDPKLLETYEKLGIPLRERGRLAGVAMDAVFDSVSVGTTFKEALAEKGVIFCSMSEAVREHPELVKKYIGSVVPYTDNFYAALNSAVFSDGSFCFIPKFSRTLYRQFLCRTELRRFQRWLILFHSQGRSLPDGTLDLFPHQRLQHRPVRTHTDCRRRGFTRQLPRRLYCADA